MVALVAMFVARQFQDRAAAGYSGLTINLEPVRVLKTVLLQLFASLPLSYYAGNPSSLFHHGLSAFAWQDILVVVLFIVLPGIGRQAD